MTGRRLTSCCAVALVLLVAGVAGAGFTEASVEPLHRNIGAPAGAVTYRIYVHFDDPEDQLLRIGGTPHLLTFFGQSALVNDGGPFGGSELEDFAACPISLPWDSWVTIGHDRFTGNDTAYDDDFCGGTDCSGEGRRIIGSSWSSTNGWFDEEPDSTPVHPDEQGRILIAQFSLDPSRGADFYLEGTVTWRDARGDDHADAFHATTNQGHPCPRDLDGDGRFGFGDLLRILAAWGPLDVCDIRMEDFDADHEIGFSDLLGLLEDWGRSCPK